LKEVGILYATTIFISMWVMNEYNFHNEIATNLKMFESAFDDTIIKRYDDVSGTVKDSIKVNYIYGPKTRILQDLRGQTDTVKFPIVAVTVTGMSRDNERIKNKLDDMVYKKPDGTHIRLKAIPWNINVEMNILSKYQTDLDQILQNFAVHSDPYIIYSWQEPKTGREMRTEVLWDNNISVEYPTEAKNTESYRITAKANFIIKTWLFRSAQSPVGTICKINTDYIFTDNFYCNYNTLLNHTSATLTESYVLSGRPILRYVAPYFIQSGDITRITLQGYNFESVESLYVSASNGMYSLTEYDPLSSGSAAFKGFMIDEFTKTPNVLTFNIPAPSGLGFVDIVAVNKCGWGRLTEDADRCNRVENPYPVTDPEHYSWCVLQFPYLNGLISTEDLNTGVVNNECQIIEVDEEPVLDRDSIIEKIRELMELGAISVDDL
jgi:hypothetical protein